MKLAIIGFFDIKKQRIAPVGRRPWLDELRNESKKDRDEKKRDAHSVLCVHLCPLIGVSVSLPWWIVLVAAHWCSPRRQAAFTRFPSSTSVPGSQSSVVRCTVRLWRSRFVSTLYTSIYVYICVTLCTRFLFFFRLYIYIYIHEVFVIVRERIGVCRLYFSHSAKVD